MGFHKIVPRQEAIKLITDSTQPLETISLTLEAALGYAASRNVYGTRDIPRFDCSAADGYAISSKDTVNASEEHPVSLKVVGEIRASTPGPPPLGRGQAVHIMTGGTIPKGADAVIKEEAVRCSTGAIEIPTVVRPSQHVWKKGKDVKMGTLVVKGGELITPPILGTLASLQIREVAVTRQPDVSVLTIGNELIGLQEGLREHKIVASNIYLLSAMVQQCGGRVTYAAVCKDDKEVITRHVQEGLKSDILITTGGSSNAQSDLTHSLMEELGIDLKFTGVRMRPGKGTSFGLFDRKLVFCLPGTPSAVYVAFHVLVLTAILGLRNLRADRRPSIKAISKADINKKPGIEHIVQGLVSKKDSLYCVAPLIGPDTEVFPAMARANGLIIVDPNETHINRGQTVSVQLLNLFDVPLPGNQPGQHGMFQAQEVTIPPVISIVGKSHTGKTTLLEKLVRELKARGHRIGTIKHDVHGFDIDHEGKDSWRHKRAGARIVAISSPKKVAIVRDVDTEELIDSLASKYFQDVDIILTEGYKRGDKPKIEVFRSQVHDEPLCGNDDSLIALVSDIAFDFGVPHFELDDIRGLADLVEQRFVRS